MHTLLREYMLAHMKGVIAKYTATINLRDSSQKGLAREALAASVVQPWFGPGVRIGTGFVIDRHGNQSLQCDNVLYWPDIQPGTHLGGDGGPGLFPVEGVAAVIEVKSTLTTTELTSALNNIRSSCRELQPGSGAPMDDTGHRPEHESTYPFGCVLAFDTNVASAAVSSELRRSADWDLVCVLGRNGAVYFRSRDGSMLKSDVRNNDERLMAFSVTVRDNIQDIRHRRGTPGLQPYVADNESLVLRYVDENDDA